MLEKTQIISIVQEYENKHNKIFPGLRALEKRLGYPQYTRAVGQAVSHLIAVGDLKRTHSKQFCTPEFAKRSNVTLAKSRKEIKNDIFDFMVEEERKTTEMVKIKQITEKFGLSPSNVSVLLSEMVKEKRILKGSKLYHTKEYLPPVPVVSSLIGTEAKQKTFTPRYTEKENIKVSNNTVQYEVVNFYLLLILTAVSLLILSKI